MKLYVCPLIFVSFVSLVSSLGVAARQRSVAPLQPDAPIEQIAKLPGEPSVISAAGVTRDEQPILTIENRSAFDPSATPYRAVLVGPRAVEMVRWFKTAAPAALRDRWAISALPSADGLDETSKQRWIAFQAADVVLDVADGESLADRLRAVTPARSPIHETLTARIARDPIAIATVLAARYPESPSISYIPALSWSNALKLATITNTAALRAKVEQQTAPWRIDDKDLFGNRIQLTSVAGTLIFADLARAGDAASRALAVKGAEAASAVKAGDVYEYGQGWTDDMFMATVVLARTSALAGRERDLDTAARMLIAYASRLQRPDGIFIHATTGPFAWGRGNGFAALGLVEALTAMPASHPSRAPLLEIYRRHMDAIRRQQAPDGMWREVIDEPGSYREETATAMLMTAMARGIRLGWIDASYRATVDRAWNGVAAHVAEDGTVIDVCTSTGAGPTKRYYLDRAAITGADDRGGAMAMLAAVEVYELRHSPAVAAQ
jgi:rhamnogalacturonyl hydrolase YesR